MKVKFPDVPPPGVGFVTDIVCVPVVEKSEVDSWMETWVAEIRVVGLVAVPS